MRLIDADAFRKELDNHYPFTKEEQSRHGMADIAKSTVLYVLEKQPTILNPTIIRCQECIFWEDMPCNTIAPEYHKCRRVFGKISMTAMDYCSGGVRRDT